MLWSGFLFGMMGSMHCLGMCGPLSVAMPVGSGNAFMLKLSYQLARVVTYVFLGVIVGQLGLLAHLTGYQQSMAIFVGVVIILMSIYSIQVEWKLSQVALFRNVSNGVRKVLGVWLPRHGYGSRIVAGLANGFLPCGLVYVALVGAAGQDTLLKSTVYMALFGLGTLPLMLLFSLGVGWLSSAWRAKLVSSMKYVGVVVGLLFLLRGLGLGIPYVSPKIHVTEGRIESACCVKPS